MCTLVAEAGDIKAVLSKCLLTVSMSDWCRTNLEVVVASANRYLYRLSCD